MSRLSNLSVEDVVKHSVFHYRMKVGLGVQNVEPSDPTML